MAGIGLLAAVTATLRLYYATMYPWWPDGADADSYVTVARYLASGGSILSDDPTGGLISVTSPGYPMTLALFSGVIALAHGSVVGWKVLQVAIAMLLALVTADLASYLYGRRAGLIAGVIALLSPVWLYSAELLQYEIWYALLIVTALWALVRMAAARRPTAWLALSGACLGACMLIQLKSLVLLIPALAHVTEYQLFRRSSEQEVRGRWGAVAALACFAALALTPLAVWGARNVILHGEPLLGSTGGGVMLWMGNHDGATGGYMQVPRPDAFYDRQRLYPATSVTRDARAFADLAMEYIATHPSRVALLAVIKLERFWWTITPERLGAFAEARTVSFLGGVDDATLQLAAKVFHYVGIGLAGVGLLFGAPLAPGAHARSGRALVIASLVLFWLVHIPFIAEPRYRIPVMPLLHVLEAAGVVICSRRLRALPWVSEGLLPARLGGSTYRAGTSGASGARVGA